MILRPLVVSSVIVFAGAVASADQWSMSYWFIEAWAVDVDSGLSEDNSDFGFDDVGGWVDTRFAGNYAFALVSLDELRATADAPLGLDFAGGGALAEISVDSPTEITFWYDLTNGADHYTVTLPPNSGGYRISGMVQTHGDNGLASMHITPAPASAALFTLLLASPRRRA